MTQKTYARTYAPLDTRVPVPLGRFRRGSPNGHTLRDNACKYADNLTSRVGTVPAICGPKSVQKTYARTYAPIPPVSGYRRLPGSRSPAPRTGSVREVGK